MLQRYVRHFRGSLALARLASVTVSRGRLVHRRASCACSAHLARRLHLRLVRLLPPLEFKRFEIHGDSLSALCFSRKPRNLGLKTQKILAAGRTVTDREIASVTCRSHGLTSQNAK